ncbi:MAG: DNA polymerase III subunit gamma/tau, partial [Synergistota bacterium]|nr:DNA polymerase III subunit gamma/tau [Synergistota bacterium]
MSVSLYRRYRPQTFEEIAGQETVVDVLKKTLQRGKIGHAWLFSGPRGCGKTSAARLLAKALNCLDLKDGYEPCGSCEQCVSISAGESLDVIEIDGASNNGVEEIRELKTHVSLSPFSAKWKVYIIDEVHMLSISAFNALLKTLEEPPPLVAFILATTEPHKIPATIRSRCQHIPFQRIDMRSMCARLEQVAVEEKAPFDPEAIRELARNSDGALRDALSLMEQAMTLGNGEVSKEAVDSLLGGGTLSDLERWVASIKEEEVEPFACLVSMFQKGASPQRIVEGVFLLFRNLWAVKRWGELVIEPLFLSVSEADF